jgi:hypothetical protein
MPLHDINIDNVLYVLMFYRRKQELEYYPEMVMYELDKAKVGDLLLFDHFFEIKLRDMHMQVQI